MDYACRMIESHPKEQDSIRIRIDSQRQNIK